MRRRAGAPQALGSAVLAPTVEGIRGIPLILASLAALGVLVLVLPAEMVASAFPRVTILGCLIGAFLALRDSRYALPVFLVALAPLRLLGTTLRVHVGEYPVTPITLALVALALAAFASRWRPSLTLLRRFTIPFGLWALIAATAAPALWAAPAAGNDPMITRLIFVMGVLEPALVFLLTLSWLQTYRDIRMFLVALLTSCFCGVITGLVAVRVGIWVGEFAISADNLSRLRFNVAGFGGANTAGFIMVLLYPLTLAFQASRRRDFLLNIVPVPAVMWGIALASFSRATPAVMGLQTLIYFVWSGTLRRSMRIVAILGLVLGVAVLAVPAEFRQAWSDRFSASDVIGMLVGRPQFLSESDDSRVRTREPLVEAIKARPWGGYAAVGTEDPESLYLDISLQLGWGPAVGFLFLQAFLLRRTWRAARSSDPSVRYTNRLLFLSLLGSVVYGATTGVNLVKGGVPSGDMDFQANNMPAIFFAVIAALALFAADPRSQAVGPRPQESRDPPQRAVRSP